MNTSVWNVDGYIEKKYDPGLGIDDGLQCLVPFPLLVHNSRLILRKPLDGVVLFLVAEEKGGHRRVRKKDKRNDGPDDGYGS